MKKKVAFLSVMAFSVLTVAGCQNELPKDQQDEIVKKYAKKVEKETNSKELKKELDQNVKKLNEKNATKMVDSFLFSIYGTIPEMNDKMLGLQTHLKEADTKEVDYADPSTFSLIKDDTVKGFVKDLETHYLFLYKEDGEYIIKPKIDVIMETYGEYISEDLKALLTFTMKEYDQNFFDKKEKKINLSVVADRIQELETYTEKYKESNYVQAFAQSKYYYYQVFFGLNNDLMKDENNLVKKEVLEDYQKMYEKMNKKEKETKFGKHLKETLNMFEKTNGSLTPEAIEMLERFSAEGMEEGNMMKDIVPQEEQAEEGKAQEANVEEDKQEPDTQKETK